MARPARQALILATLLLTVAPTVRGANADASNARTAYNAWIAKYSTKSLDGNLLVITLIGEERGNGWASVSTFTVKSDGECWGRSSGRFGTRGGSGNAVSQETLAHLKELGSKLPDDGGELPFPERRILIQTPQGSHVYDRAELPDAVAELLRISGSGIGTWRLTFKPQGQTDVRAGGVLCLAPDGKRLVCGMQLLAIPTYENLGELRVESGCTEAAFSPDGATAALCRLECQIFDVATCMPVKKLSDVPHEKLGSHFPCFTPDSRYLVFGLDDGLRFFETKTWERVAIIPEVPPEALQWKPSASWKYAVMRAKGGVISAWDTKTRTACQLDPAAPLLDAAFSPDESQVALVTSDQNGYSNPRLRVFQTKTGQLVHELRVGGIGCDRLTFPQWTPNGQYVLAVTKPSSFFDDENISLWNAKTGRHRADFVSGTRVFGALLLSPGDQLIASCFGGQLRSWDFAAAIKQVVALEQSFAPIAGTQTTTHDH